METIGNYLTRVNKVRLKKIRNKKTTKIKKPLVIFDCLTRVPEVKIEKPVIIEAPKPDRKIEKTRRRLHVLKKLYLKGGLYKNKHFLRYVRWATFLGEEIPEDILKKKEELYPKRIKKEKKKKVKIKKRKRKPRKYDAYINSHLWTKRRNAFYKRYGRQCAVCGSVDYIHLHHKYYGEYGEEKDEHLVALCKEHHEEFHTTLGRTKKDMIKETDHFIELKKIVLLQHKE